MLGDDLFVGIDVLFPELFEFYQRYDARPSSWLAPGVKGLRVYVDAFPAFPAEDPLVDPLLEETADPAEISPAFLHVRILSEDQPDEVVGGKLEESLLVSLADDVIRGADDLRDVLDVISVTLEGFDRYHLIGFLFDSRG
jgi:hypothetical protein